MPHGDALQVENLRPHGLLDFSNDLKRSLRFGLQMTVRVLGGDPNGPAGTAIRSVPFGGVIRTGVGSPTLIRA